MNIIVTGATGFLGAHLCRFLEGKGHSPQRLDSKICDLRSPDSLRRFDGVKYDLIFHLAAWTQAGDFCLRHPADQWVVNQLINTNVLSWWQESQPGAKLVCMGTSCAYAPDSGLRESEFMAGEPIDSLYTYAMTKRMLYQGVRAMNAQYGMRYLCAVPSTLYGAGYHTDGRQMHFIFDLIRKILRGKEYGEAVSLWGDGHQKRELILVNDFVGILWYFVENHDNDIFNIGAGEEHSIREFAEIICREVGYDHDKIHYDVTKYVGAKSKVLNMEKTKAELGALRLVPLRDGIAETVAWFRETGAHRGSVS